MGKLTVTHAVATGLIDIDGPALSRDERLGLIKSINEELAAYQYVVRRSQPSNLPWDTRVQRYVLLQRTHEWGLTRRGRGRLSTVLQLFLDSLPHGGLDTF
jgi:hypothetical protein